MITYFCSKSELNIGKLKHLYRQRIEEQRSLKYGNFSCSLGMLEAEQDFYFNIDSMFNIEGSAIAVLRLNDTYISSLRLEKMDDGVLINGFETDPDYVGRGYGKLLMMRVCDDVKRNSNLQIFSHIKPDNAVSIHLHEVCGFKILHRFANLLDGSKSFDYYTWVL